jgi:hypothetical protein
MKPITLDECEITTYCEPEDDDGPEGYSDDAETCANIRAWLESGNEWAWCVACVKVEYKGIASTQYLGACSYDGATDFRDNSGYWHDMCEEALAEINTRVAELQR